MSHKSGSPAHILMSHGGHQVHGAAHDTFRTAKCGKYATGGHVEDEKMKRGGRRHHRGRHHNPHTGHSQYWGMSDIMGGLNKAKDIARGGLDMANKFAPLAGQFLPENVSGKLNQGLNMANKANNTAKMFGFAEGGHVNHGTGHPQYWGFSDFMSGLNKAKDAARTGLDIVNQHAPILHSLLPETVSNKVNQGLNMANKANNAAQMMGFAEGGHVNPHSGHPGYGLLGSILGGGLGHLLPFAEGGHVNHMSGHPAYGMLSGLLSSFLPFAEGGTVPIEGQARGNASGGMMRPMGGSAIDSDNRGSAGGEHYADGGQTMSTPQYWGQYFRDHPGAASQKAMRRGGRRHSKHHNPHTGHPQYFGFGDFLNGIKDVADTVSHVGGTIAGPLMHMMPGGLPFAEGGHVEQEPKMRRGGRRRHHMHRAMGGAGKTRKHYPNT